MKLKHRYLKVMPLVLWLGILGAGDSVLAQLGELRWLRVGALQHFFSEQGAKTESGRAAQKTICDGMAWPAEYGFEEQSTIAATSLWIGCKDYYDPIMQKTYSYKVVGRGPRDHLKWQDEIYPVQLKMIGRYNHPRVVVDGETATDNELYDKVDEIDENQICDRLIINKFHTSMGVTVTRKIMGFSQQNHDNYFITEYVFKNTGIINNKGGAYPQTLKDCYFGMSYRYAFSGESVTGYNVGWGTWGSTWGVNCVNQVVGRNPAAPDFQYRAQYAWYGPLSERNVPDDWGCPNEKANLNDAIPDEILASARYIGAITLHADKSITDRTDDLSQPVSTPYLSSDNEIYGFGASVSQYDALLMQKRYEFMSAGHQAKTQAEEVGDQFVDVWSSDLGGYSSSQGFGPYTLKVGDSIRIIMAEAVNGISRPKNREVALNWLTYVNAVGKPKLIMPNGSETSDHNLYKRAWVKTGQDSILQTFSRILKAYQQNFNFPQPPPPPKVFTVASGGDRIRLSWDQNAETHPNFNGYEVWRSKGVVHQPTTVYEKIYSCDRANLTATFDDTSAKRGVDYYYFVVSKDDGSTNDIKRGKPLVSSKFYTLTNKPAYLRRMAGNQIEEIRVVPNPFVISKRALQFGMETGYDRIAFYNIPPFCKISIYTERGDLIWQKRHDNGSGDELWESVTSSGQIVVSGLYIAYFEVTEDYADPKTGKELFKKGEHTYRKFVVIR